jgi:LacI family transcriptional regulator
VPQRHVTLQDVAKEAGVHRATASRALNPDRRSLVNDETVARVRAAAEKLGYVADPVAQALRGGASRQIGVLIRTSTHPWVGDFLRGTDAALTSAGYFPWITFTGDHSPRVQALAQAMAAWRIEGLIIATGRVSDEVIMEVAATGVPMVVVARSSPDQVCSVVSADNEAGSRTAAQYLIREGHTRIGYVAGPREVPVLRDRLRGFKDAIDESGVKPDPRLIRIAGGYSIADGEAACADLLASGRRITAIAAGDDDLAVGCCVALEKAKLRVPEDISVIGFDDLPLTAELRPALSTMRHPSYAMGVEAAEQIMAQIDDPSIPKRRVLLSAELVVRQSTGPPAVA